jgi:hypothetical protein
MLLGHPLAAIANSPCCAGLVASFRVVENLEDCLHILSFWLACARCSLIINLMIAN